MSAVIATEVQQMNFQPQQNETLIMPGSSEKCRTLRNASDTFYVMR